MTLGSVIPSGAGDCAHGPKGVRRQLKVTIRRKLVTEYEGGGGVESINCKGPVSEEIFFDT